jgi:hypothetical protein
MEPRRWAGVLPLPDQYTGNLAFKNGGSVDAFSGLQPGVVQDHTLRVVPTGYLVVRSTLVPLRCFVPSPPDWRLDTSGFIYKPNLSTCLEGIMQKLAAGFLGLNAFLFIVIGGMSLVTLNPILSYLGLDPAVVSLDASNDFRANYGGFYFGFGVMLAFAAFQSAYRVAGLFSLTTIFVFVVLGRVIDLVVLGLPSGKVMAFLIGEIVTIIVCLALLAGLNKASS